LNTNGRTGVRFWRALSCVAVAATTLGSFGCGSDDAAPDPTTTGARVRVLHLSPDAPPIQALVDGAEPAGFGPIAFGESSGYAAVSTGAHELDVTADGTAAGSVLKVPGLQFESGSYTAVALGKVAQIQALFFPDSPAGLAAGSIRVRAIHAAPSVGQVDVYAIDPETGAPTELVKNVDFGDASAPLDVAAGAYTLGVDLDNDMKPEVYLELPGLEAGTLANVYVTEDEGGKVFALAQLDGATTAKVLPSTSELRVVHLSRDAPNVDVYANGAKVVTDLAYASSTDALVVPSGTYDVAVTATGAAIGTAVINAPGVTLAPGRAYTVAAYDDLSSIKPVVLEDTSAGLNKAADIRLQIVHVAPTVTRGDLFSVTPGGNTLLIDDIGFGEFSTTPDVPSSSYTVGFDAEANGVIDIAFDLPVLAPGSIANVFVATDAAEAVYLLVQTTGSGAIRVDPNP
jgi:hypothetical protein